MLASAPSWRANRSEPSTGCVLRQTVRRRGRGAWTRELAGRQGPRAQQTLRIDGSRTPAAETPRPQAGLETTTTPNFPCCLLFALLLYSTTSRLRKITAGRCAGCGVSGVRTRMADRVTGVGCDTARDGLGERSWTGSVPAESHHQLNQLDQIIRHELRRISCPQQQLRVQQ